MQGIQTLGGLIAVKATTHDFIGTHSSKSKDFITKCLKKNPKERLGSKNGPDEIINHPWFSDLNADDVLSK